VALEGQRELSGGHAEAVIGDGDQRRPAIAHLEADRRGAGVEAVFHELLHDRSRALDHLARCDLVDQGIGEQTDPALLRGRLSVFTLRELGSAHRRWGFSC
jgi:hypothetical protein